MTRKGRRRFFTPPRPSGNSFSAVPSVYTYLSSVSSSSSSSNCNPPPISGFVVQAGIPQPSSLHAPNPNILLPQLPYPNFFNPLIQNNGFQFAPPQNQGLQIPSFTTSNVSLEKTLERVESAAVKAHQAIVEAGESATSWKVSQAILLHLKVDSWSKLGFQMQDIPTLRRLIVTEGKVNAFIHCFVGARRVTSLYDLELELLKCEGIDRFEELGLGPLYRHPLIIHYFSVPSSVKEVFKITSDDIICYLDRFMYKCKSKKINPDEFLDYIAGLKSVTVSCKEELGIRIQSLGLHIKYIWLARKADTDCFRKCASVINQFDHKKVCSEENTSSLSKKGLSKNQNFDARFNSISKRVELFSSTWDGLGNSHIRFDSSGTDEDDSSSQKGGEELSNTSRIHGSDDKAGIQRVSACPYPSTTEELMRIGKITEASGSHSSSRGNGSSDRKRKLEACLRNKNAESRTEKGGNCCLSLASGEVDKFITTWKGACREHDIAKVLQMMINFYLSKKKKTARKVFSSYPGIALLNVAVKSIQRGMLDSLYDTMQSMSELGVVGQCCPSDEILEVGSPLKENSVLHNNDAIKALGYVIPDDEIIKKVVNYFESNDLMLTESDHLWSSFFSLLKWIQECERWLCSQYSVQGFECFRHGSFIDFLGRHYSLLPTKMFNVFHGVQSESSHVYVSMHKKLLRLMLSQSEINITNKEVVSENFYGQLRQQFPTMSFCEVAKNKKSFVDLIEEQENVDASCSLLFSTTLLGSQSHVNLSTEFNKDKSYITISTNDVIECLLKAPMLSDILSWSHWDVKYAPSFGSLLEWLLSEVQVKELLCIATVGGKLLRIDHCATVDEFSESLVQCSPFHVALKLLSLLAIYKGIGSFPMRLLKCCAKRAIEVIMRNCIENFRDDSSVEKVVGENSFKEQIYYGKHRLLNHSVDCCGTSMLVLKETSVNLSGNENAISFVSRFMLDCLSYLPPEFHNFGAEILISNLRDFDHSANAVVLHQCRHMEERVMLHSIGFALGITEWIEDFQVFSSVSAGCLLSSSRNLNSSSHLSCVSGGQALQTSKENVSRSYELVSRSSFPSGEENAAIQKQRNIIGSSENVVETYSVDEVKLVSQFSSGFMMGEDEEMNDATNFVESIRREEFGMGTNLSSSEYNLLEKQHARLGRALNCLSQELYSQDSHLILELIQNADDNSYPENVDPTLIFVLQDTGIAVINNEIGFSAQNIRALCDIGNSTKRERMAGYIGHKGIGFKSVFRVTDAPEIHSNGFHVKFDISEGQIGFVLPTVIPPCDTKPFQMLLTGDGNMRRLDVWKTCILLPFRSIIKDGPGLNTVIKMFRDVHPSLLLFLHRLRCIKFRNMLDNSLLILRKDVLDNGIVKVSHGSKAMSWLVVSTELDASILRPEVQKTEISLAFTLQESEDGDYEPLLEQQPVFAFLPLRTYGLKFILQGDFSLPSSREEVDGDSAWNQWLLSEFPRLFVIAEQSFCSLPCFHQSPGKGVTTYMSFVPLFGEVHGFFGPLPSMIISKLRMSKCLLLDQPGFEWVLPCRILRGWGEQFRTLVPASFLNEHLGLGYLDKNITLSDALARALGVQECGPKILVEILTCICRTNASITSISLEWLSSCLSAIYLMLTTQSLGSNSCVSGYDPISYLRRIPFVPLSDGSFSSVSDGQIWLPCDTHVVGSDDNCDTKDYPHLYAKLRTVNPFLFTRVASNTFLKDAGSENVVRMLRKIGIQDLSAHEVIKGHILVSLADNGHVNETKELLVDYLAFIMLHFQSPCPACLTEKGEIILELSKRLIFLTNYGFKCPNDVGIHFTKDFGNPFDIERLVDGPFINWCVVNSVYLKHPVTQRLCNALTSWRAFFLDFGVTDFVKVVSVHKDLPNELYMHIDSLMLTECYFSDWESPELLDLLSMISAEGSRQKSIYLMEILDRTWDENYSTKSRGCIVSRTGERLKLVESTFVKNFQQFSWISSTLDNQLHFSNDLFFDCEEVRSILGNFAPYGVPKGTSRLLLEDIGFKTQVSLDEALKVFYVWLFSDAPHMASLAQMSKFYAFIADGVKTSQFSAIKELVSHACIFVPISRNFGYNDDVHGILSFPNEVYWHDPSGCMDKAKDIIFARTSKVDDSKFLCKDLATLYPSLQDFFVNVCGAPTVPSFGCYFEILLQLSRVALPSNSAHVVFEVFLKLAYDLSAGLIKPEEAFSMKECLLKQEYAILPTLQDKWVSLHPSFGLICWADDEDLKKQFKLLEKVDFVHFGELGSKEKDLLYANVAVLLQKLGIRRISEVVSREAIFYGTASNEEKTQLINWVLPYAQCYLHKLHPDRYHKLKHLGFEKINQLQVIVVEKLFYKYTIKECNGASKKRIECNSLLQGNILYVSNAADHHSIFLELSRVFFDGSSELHLANFFHMITTMAESGSSSDQIEFFMVNSQNIPVLPTEEPCWYHQSLMQLGDCGDSQPVSAGPVNTEEIASERRRRKSGIIVNWPPTDWKTAPDRTYARTNYKLTNPNSMHSDALEKENYETHQAAASEDDDILVPIEIEEYFITSSNISPLVLEDEKPPFLDDLDPFEAMKTSSFTELASTNNSRKVDGKPKWDVIPLHAPDGVDRVELQRIGRLGELTAYRYFVQKYGTANVKWVNKELETGLPFDLIITADGESKEFVEVKATKSAKKNWFFVTTREWQYAVENGDACSICHVHLRPDNKAKITVLKNPLKLCKENVLHLALLMSSNSSLPNVTNVP